MKQEQADRNKDTTRKSSWKLKLLNGKIDRIDRMKNKIEESS